MSGSKVAELISKFQNAFPEFKPSGYTAPVASPADQKLLAALNKQVVKIRDDIATGVAKAGKPIALKERLAFCQSDINDLKTQIDKLDVTAMGAGKRDLVAAAATLGADLAKAQSDGMARALAKLDACNSSVAGTLTALAAEVGSAADPGTCYGKVSKALSAAMREQSDWAAQVREAGGWLGGSAARFEVGVQQLGETCSALDALVARCLPKLTTTLTRPPPPTGGLPPPPLEIDPEAEDERIREQCDKSWVEAKAQFGGNEGRQMEKLAKFRKDTVDKWLRDHLTEWGMKEGPGAGWVSVGSSDPTSDYDISINKHGEKGEGDTKERMLDCDIVKLFNSSFRADYGVESGTVFDTNLYASAPPMVAELRPGASEAETAAMADVAASNDVGALMKLRRYMSAADFDDYRARTLDAAGGKQRKALEAQFRQADDNYMISVLTTIEKIESMLADKLKDGDELTEDQREAHEIIAAWRAASQDLTSLALADGADAMEKVARELEHCKDANTMATNELYGDTVAAVREQEGKIKTAQDNAVEIHKLLAAAKLPEGDPAAYLAGLGEKLARLGAGPGVARAIAAGDFKAAGDGVDKDCADMLAELARQSALAMFYANEAYQSGGPFKHVVMATQAVESDVKSTTAETALGKEAFDLLTPEARATAIKDEWAKLSKEAQDLAVSTERTRRRAELTQEEVLQSFNEQLGDFLKDLAHYGDEPPGVAIIQSSKYLERLVDALRLMNDRDVFAGATDLQALVAKELSHQDAITKELIGARKGLVKMDPPKGEGAEAVDFQKEQRRAFACDFMAKLGITSVAGLAKTYTGLGISVNAAARRKMAAG